MENIMDCLECRTFRGAVSLIRKVSARREEVWSNKEAAAGITGICFLQRREEERRGGIIKKRPGCSGRTPGWDYLLYADGLDGVIYICIGAATEFDPGNSQAFVTVLFNFCSIYRACAQVFWVVGNKFCKDDSGTVITTVYGFLVRHNATHLIAEATHGVAFYNVGSGRITVLIRDEFNKVAVVIGIGLFAHIHGHIKDIFLPSRLGSHWLVFFTGQSGIPGGYACVTVVPGSAD